MITASKFQIADGQFIGVHVTRDYLTHLQHLDGGTPSGNEKYRNLHGGLIGTTNEERDYAALVDGQESRGASQLKSFVARRMPEGPSVTPP